MEYIEKVRQFVVSTFLLGDGELLKDDTSFLEQGILDSTGILELIMFLEESFGIKIEDDDLVPENLDSLERIAAFLDRKVAKSSA